MGGKSETQNGMSAGMLYKGDNKLFFKDFLRSTVSMGLSNPIENFKFLITSSAWMWNYALLKKYGFLIEIEGITEAVTAASVVAYVQATDPLATTIIDYTRTTDTYPYGDAFMKLAYTQTGVDTADFITTYSGVTTHIPAKLYQVGGVDKRMAGAGGQPIISGGQLSLSDPGQFDSNVTQIAIPSDTSVYYIVSYNKSDGSKAVLYVDQSSLVTEDTTIRLFEFPMKKDKKNILDSDKELAFLTKLGFEKESFKDMANNDDAKDFFLTYSASRDQAAYAPAINDIYGTVNNPNYVHITGSDYNTGYASGRITVNGVEHVVASDEQMWMMPLDLDLAGGEKGFHKRYQQLDDLFAYIAVLENDVDIKWYQTQWFQMVSFIIAIALTIITENPLPMLLWIGGRIVNEFVLLAFGPEAAKYVGYIIGIVAILYGDWSNIYSIVGNVSGLVSLASSIWFSYEMDNIKAEMEEIAENTEDVNDEIEDLARKVIYNPFQAYGAYYDFVYNANSFYYDNATVRRSSFSHNMYSPFQS